MLTPSEFEDWCRELQLSPAAREMIATPGIPLAAVVGEGSGIRANDVYAMLGLDILYTDLHAAHLLQAWRVHLYLDRAQTEAYAHLLPVRVTERDGTSLSDSASAFAPNALLLWDGRPWTVVNPGETTITLIPEVGLPVQIPSTPRRMMLERGAHSNWAKKGVIRDVFWEWIADSMPEESKW